MPKEYTLIGGNGTVVSPLEVTEDGDYVAGDSRAFNPVKVRIGGGASTLSGLTDVDISNPTDGQTLVYNAATGKWENGAGGGGYKLFEVTFMAVELGYSFTYRGIAITSNGVTASDFEANVDVGSPLTLKLVSFSDSLAINTSDFDISESYMPVCTGGVEFVHGVFMVSGDGTITCKGQNIS